MTNWGAWSTGGTNSFRIGWDATFSGTSLNVWISIQNQYNVYGDGISLGWSGSFSGSRAATLTSNAGGTTQIYAGSIGTQAYNTTTSTTFTVTGLYTGTNPSVPMVLTLNPLPPNSPSAPTATRINDGQTNLSWTNNITSDRPYDTITVYRNNGSGWSIINTIAGSSVSYSDTTTVVDSRYQYDIWANNTAGGSGGTVGSSFIYTTPNAPTSMVATKNSGGDIVLTWTNNTSYASYATIAIEESTNGGSTWATLSGAGSLAGTTTTFTHTAPSTGTTHTYRVKHVSPTSISSTFATSNTVTLLSVPNAPSLYTTPFAAPNSPPGNNVGPETFDATYPVTFVWNHNPTDSSPQSAYEVSVQVSTDNGSTWGTATTTGKVTSTSNYITYAANTWTNGTTRKIRWQVRTWGAHASPSDYSSQVPFFTQAIPVATITSSNTWTSPANPVVTGTYSSALSGSAQEAVRWALRYTFGSSLDSYLSSTGDTSRYTTNTFSFTPANQTSYIVSYQVKSANGLWSNEATQLVTASFFTPPTPSLTSLTFDPVTGKVTGVISNPAPGGSQVAAVSNRVYRDGVPLSGLSEVAPNASFVDYPPLNSTVIYSVVAVSSYPSYSPAGISTVTTLGNPITQVLSSPVLPVGWYVDGVPLSTKAFNVENRSAGWSMPAPIGDNIKVPGRSGSFWVSDKPFDETELNLNMWALGATSDGLIPSDISSQQQCLRNLDGLSSLFGKGRLLEIKRSSASAEEGLINRVINPSFHGASKISDWTNLVPGWATRGELTFVTNYFQNPNLSTLNTTLSKYTDATRTAITVDGVSKYAAVKTAGSTGPLSITLTGTANRVTNSWVAGATLWDSPSATPALSGNITIQIQLRASTSVVYTSSSVVQYVRDKTFYAFAKPPSGTTYDNYIVTFTTDSVTSGTTFGLYSPFFNSSRAWPQALAGDMPATEIYTGIYSYGWIGAVNDSRSYMQTKSKFTYNDVVVASTGKSPCLLDGQDVGASLTSFGDYLLSPSVVLAGMNSAEISFSVNANGQAGQWLYFNLDADVTRTPFAVRLELWNYGSLVAFQPYGTSADGPSTISTDGMMQAPGNFNKVVVRFSPVGTATATPQYYLGGQKVQINNLALLLESQNPVLTAGYVPRYFPSEQLSSFPVSSAIPRTYSGYMLIAPKTGSVTVTLTDGTTTQGPFVITEPTIINPAWSSSPWTYSVTPNGNFYHVSTGYRTGDATTLPPPLWNGVKFTDTPVWNSNMQVSNTSGWINAISSNARSSSAYLPTGTLSYTYSSPVIALESGALNLSGSLKISPKIKPFSVISSASVKTSTSYTMQVSLMSYSSATGASPTVLSTQTVTADTTIKWLNVPTTTTFAGVRISLVVTSPTATPYGPQFEMSDFILTSSSTARTYPVPFFDGDTVGCTWVGTRYMSPSVYGGAVRRAYAEVSDAIDFSSMAGGTRAVFNVALRIPGVFWEDPLESSFSADITASSGVNYEIPLTPFTGSTAPIEDALITVTITAGTSTDLTLIDKATGATLIFTKTFVPGTTISIIGGGANDNAYSAQDQDGNSLVPYMTRKNTSRFLPLTPLNSTDVSTPLAPVLVVRSTGDITATVTATGHRKFFLA